VSRPEKAAAGQARPSIQAFGTFCQAGVRRRPPVSAEQWATLRGHVERQHGRFAALDPASPRLRPTLASISLVDGEGAQ
jgi:hypothetical protein